MKRQQTRWSSMIAAPLFLAAFLIGCGKGSSEEAPEGASSTSVLDKIMPSPSITIPEGTVLKVRLGPKLSTKDNAVGDAFDATLVEPLVVEGKTVAPRGARVRGKVVEADKGGRVQGRARIGVQLTGLETADGEKVDIATNTVSRAARSTKKKDAEKIGIGAGVGAAIGAVAGGGKGAAVGAASGAGAGTGVVLATRGAPAELPSETVLSFKLQYPVKVS